MGIAVFNESTLRLERWIEAGPAPPAEVGFAQVVVGSPPNYITDRYDGAGGIRAADQSELDADAQVVRDALKDAYDGVTKLEFRALGDVLVTLYNDLITKINAETGSSYPSRTRAQLRTQYRNSLDDLTL